MRNNSPTINGLNGSATDFAALQAGLQRGWNRLLVALRSPVGSGVLGILIILGMLLAFHQVVHGAVQQGALRLKATAMHAQATQRCNALRDPITRENCRLQLNALVAGRV